MDGDYGRRGEEKGDGRREMMEDGDFLYDCWRRRKSRGGFRGREARERGKDGCVCMSF
jgi:hypothetical protein